MARTKPGTDLPTRLEKLLSQTHGQCTELISTVDEVDDLGEQSDDDGEDDDDDGGPIRVTVREVLKYSLT